MKKGFSSEISRTHLQPPGNYFGKPSETTFALGGLRPTKQTNSFFDDQENEDLNANEIKASPFVQDFVKSTFKPV